MSESDGTGGTGPTHPMDSELGAVHKALHQHESRFVNLENKLDAAFAGVLARLDAMSRNPPIQPPSTTSPPALDPGAPPPAAVLAPPNVREPKIASPKPFEGDFELCRGFLVQCELIFTHQPSRYASDGARVAFILSLLSGRALRWATAAVDQSNGLATNYSAFRTEFRAVFDHPEDGGDAASRLHSIQQGSRSVADYTLEFRILAADSGWGDKALQSAYRRGLSEAVKDGLLRDRPTSYNALIELALQMDQRLRERRAERAHRAPMMYTKPTHVETRAHPNPAPVSYVPPTHPPLVPRSVSSPVTPQTEEPMQLGRSRLAAEERERRFQQRLCLYCGLAGHVIRDCPTRPKDKAH